MNNFIKIQELSKNLDKPICLVDLETTSLLNKDPDIFGIIEIALIYIDKDKIERTSSLLNPGIKLSYFCKDITGITDNMLYGKPSFEKYAKYMDEQLNNCLIVGFNSKKFDTKALLQECKKYNENTIEEKDVLQLDVRDLYLYDKKQNNLKDNKGTLLVACQEHNIVFPGTAHRASYDIEITAMLLEKLLHKYSFDVVKKIINNEKEEKNFKEKKEYKQSTIKTILISIIEEHIKLGKNQKIDFINHELLKSYTKSSISFTLSDLADKEEYSNFLTTQEVQNNILSVLDKAIEVSWICDNTKNKLKPLMNYYIKENIIIDYTDLKIALRNHKKPKIEQKLIVNNKKFNFNF